MGSDRSTIESLIFFLAGEGGTLAKVAAAKLIQPLARLPQLRNFLM